MEIREGLPSNTISLLQLLDVGTSGLDDTDTLVAQDHVGGLVVDVGVAQPGGGDLEQNLIAGELIGLSGGGFRGQALLGALVHGEGRHCHGCLLDGLLVGRRGSRQGTVGLMRIEVLKVNSARDEWIFALLIGCGGRCGQVWTATHPYYRQKAKTSEWVPCGLPTMPEQSMTFGNKSNKEKICYRLSVRPPSAASTYAKGRLVRNIICGPGRLRNEAMLRIPEVFPRSCPRLGRKWNCVEDFPRPARF